MRSSSIAAAALSIGQYHLASISRLCIVQHANNPPGSTAFAQLAEQCNGDICYQLNIPQSTADSGDGDIFIQMKAPSSYEWVGLGQGSSMSGANMFIMYQSADGNNVTISPRSGSGHNEPSVDSSADITMLEGSGVEGDTMTANFRCGSCSGSTMDFSGSSASWIHASASGSPIQSDSLDETISQHSRDYGSFDWDFSDGKGGSEVNPLLAASGPSNSGSGSSSGSSDSTATSGSAAATCTQAPSQTLASVTGTSGCPTAWPTEYSTAWPTARPTWAADCNPEGSGPGGRGPGSWPTDAPWRNNNEKRQLPECEEGESPTGGSSSSNQLSQNGRSGAFGAQRQTMIMAHGVMASLAFVGLFPIGGILIRAASFTGLVWVHAVLQVLAFLIYIAAFGIGIYVAMNSQYLTRAHPIIGIVLFIILFAQPLGGLLHHRYFKKYGRRTTVSYAHIGIGRIAIILGMVNGGLGLQLAGAQGSSVIAYAVVAAVMGVLYIASIIYGERKRSRRTPAQAPPPQYDGRHKEQQRHYESSNGSMFEVPSPPRGGHREFYSGRDSRR